MNEGHLSRPPNSNVESSLYLKIKNNYILNNKNNFILTSNPNFFYSTSINTNEYKKNKTFSGIERQKNYYNNSYSEIKRIKKRNSYLINNKYLYINKFNKNKNKSSNNFNFILDSKKNKNKNKKIFKLKQNSLLTYNFNKDIQKLHYSTIIFKKKEIIKNKNIVNLKNLENNFTNLITDYSYKTKNNKNLRKDLIKRNTNQKLNFKSTISNKMDISEKDERNIYKTKSDNNNLYDNNVLKKIKSKTNSKICHKLIDSPDSMFYYIFRLIKDKQNEDNLKQKIYYSKLDMTKKFRYFKKGLEKLEQRTNFEIFNLQRQIIPEQETKLTKKIISNL